MYTGMIHGKRATKIKVFFSTLVLRTVLFELTPLLLNTLAACALTLLAAGLLLGAVKEVKDFLALDAEPEVLGQCNMMLLL